MTNNGPIPTVVAEKGATSHCYTEPHPIKLVCTRYTVCAENVFIILVISGTAD